MQNVTVSGFTGQRYTLTLVASVIDGLHKEVAEVVNENTRTLFRRLAAELRTVAAAQGPAI